MNKFKKYVLVPIFSGIGIFVLLVLLTVLSIKLGFLLALFITSFFVLAIPSILKVVLSIDNALKQRIHSVISSTVVFIWVIVGIANMGAWVIGYLKTPSGENISNIQEKVTYDDVEIYVSAQIILENFLKSPSTAKYPVSSSANIERLGDNLFKVYSYVDSQNGFGVMIRNEWMVLFQMSEMGQKVYQVIIDGTEVYRDKDI